jgi:DNA modification methylase
MKMSQDSNVFKQLGNKLSKVISSTKPSVRRTGIESWFPYYAGYSPEFVEATLECLATDPRARVLDPWNGSGTTTAVADRFGCNAIGFDINPVAVLVASARLVRAQDALHTEGLVQEILAKADQGSESKASDPLTPWLSRQIRCRYRAIERSILDLLASRNGRRVDPTKDAMPPLASFLLLCLIRAAKKYVHKADNSNPTWSQPKRAGRASPDSLDSAFIKMVAQSAVDTEKELLESCTRQTGSYSRLADSRYLPLESSSVDSVITSPPYCTRLDYAKATEFELAAIGVASNDAFHRLLRESAMGTNLIRKSTDIAPTNQLPKDVVRLLQQIKSHDSKASAGYYLKHYSQYFEDAQRSIKEISRVLKSSGTAIFVVQSSYYKEIPIPLGELFVSMAKQAGMNSKVVTKFPVNKVLTTLNTRSTKYLRNREYSECVVAAVKTG